MATKLGHFLWSQCVCINYLVGFWYYLINNGIAFCCIKISYWIRWPRGQLKQWALRRPSCNIHFYSILVVVAKIRSKYKASVIRCQWCSGQVFTRQTWCDHNGPLSIKMCLCVCSLQFYFWISTVLLTVFGATRKKWKWESKRILCSAAGIHWHLQCGV